MITFLKKAFLSRKFLGFAFATVLMFCGRFDSYAWLGAYAIYAVSNVGSKIVSNTVNRVTGGEQ